MGGDEDDGAGKLVSGGSAAVGDSCTGTHLHAHESASIAVVVSEVCEADLPARAVTLREERLPRSLRRLLPSLQADADAPCMHLARASSSSQPPEQTSEDARAATVGPLALERSRAPCTSSPENDSE